MIRYSLTIFLAALVIATGYLVWQYFSSPNFNKLNYVQQKIIHQINNKWDKYVKALPPEQQNIPEYDELMALLNPIESNLAKRILAINPADLGFKGTYFGIEKPGELVSIPSKKYRFRDIDIETGVNFVSPMIMGDLEKLNQAMQSEIGKQLDIENAYRTPGLSAKLFFWYLEYENGWSLLENAKWIAMPGYSEHNKYQNTAIDFINQEGISGGDTNQTPADFEALPEYAWLTQNASKYNFYLTYPKDNPFGVEFEPWHWHWEKK